MATQIPAHNSAKAKELDRVFTDLRTLDLVGFTNYVESLGEPPYRAKQIYKWVHQVGIRSLDEMTNLSKALRKRIGETAYLSSLNVDSVQKSKDGTRKYAFRTSQNDIVESVFIPNASAEGRNTLCISSQVGCALDCTFCLTASLGLRRNLNGGEIAEQLTRVKEDLGQDVALQNIVMMGMGEPLHNYKNLIQAVSIINSEDGHNISPRRITVSTAGLASKIPDLGRDTSVCLAVSLNATTDEIRDQIMPINKKWNIQALLDACKTFPLEQRRRITFEYVLLAGVNDSEADARRLAKLLQPFRCKINLIPFNEHAQSSYRRPAPNVVSDFTDYLRSKQFTTFVRAARGDDISAACGQLGVEVTRNPAVTGKSQDMGGLGLNVNSRLPVVEDEVPC